MSQYPKYDEDKHTLYATFDTEQDGDAYIYETDNETVLMLKHGNSRSLSSFEWDELTPDERAEKLQFYNDTGRYDIIIQPSELND